MDSSCRWDFIYPANVILSISFQRACILEICFHFCSIPYFNLLLGDKILVLQNLDEFTTRLIKSYHRQLSSAQRYIYELWVKYVLKAVLKKRQTHTKKKHRKLILHAICCWLFNIYLATRACFKKLNWCWWLQEITPLYSFYKTQRTDGNRSYMAIRDAGPTASRSQQ